MCNFSVRMLGNVHDGQPLASVLLDKKKERERAEMKKCNSVTVVLRISPVSISAEMVLLVRKNEIAYPRRTRLPDEVDEVHLFIHCIRPSASGGPKGSARALPSATLNLSMGPRRVSLCMYASEFKGGCKGLVRCILPG